MDHNSIIDRTTYEVYQHSEDYPKAFICDKQIAPAIAILNKKGYETSASCQGHYRVEFYEWFDEDLSYLEEAKANPRIIIKNIKKHSFDYWEEVTKTEIYILFKFEYKFSDCPKGFELSRDLDYYDVPRTSLRCVINYYDENNKKKKRLVVEQEIANKCELLKEWAISLP